MHRKRHEQALGTLKASTLDALCDPLGVQYRGPGGEAIIYICVMPCKYTNISGGLFVVRRSDRLCDGID